MWFNNFLAWLLGAPSIWNVESDLVISTDCPLSFAEQYPQCPNWAQREFDFIIVGAGTAGSTLANRLTENPDWNVLLIEAGSVPSNLSQIPALFIGLQKTAEDWSYQVRDVRNFKAYKNSQFSMAKGKALGGSSTINSMATVIGIPQDYDRWAELGNEGWKWSNVTKYFDKVQEQIKPILYRSTASWRDVIDNAVKELGVDSNSAGIYGYRDIAIQTKDGQRNSHAKAYLSPIINRNNLCVVTEKLVTGLWIHPTGYIEGVTLSDFNGRQIRVRATTEVILSAGAVNTPQLLLLSGIGPRLHLQSMGIRVKVDLPVGRNLMDHMAVPMMLQEINPTTVQSPQVSFNQVLDNYCHVQNKTGTDLENIGISNYQGYISTLNKTTWSDSNHRPNIELIQYTFDVQDPLLNLTLDRFGFADVYNTQLKTINDERALLVMLIDLLHPKSRGTIELYTSDPFVQPKIDLNFLSNPDDVQTILDGIEFIKKLANTQSLSNYEIISFPGSDYAFDSAEYWEWYSRAFAMSVFHASGTCTMGNDSTTSVVNPRLQVWGVPKLRIVDASVIPDMMTGHTNFPVGMIAEKAADFIKEDYNY